MNRSFIFWRLQQRLLCLLYLHLYLCVSSNGFHYTQQAQCDTHKCIFSSSLPPQKLPFPSCMDLKINAWSSKSRMRLVNGTSGLISGGGFFFLLCTHYTHLCYSLPLLPLWEHDLTASVHENLSNGVS